MGSAPSLPTGATDNNPSQVVSPVSAGKAAGAVAFALSQLGKPYRVGPGRFGPAYFDCSGLVKAAYASQGIQISDVSYDQAADGRAIPVDPQYVRPGDLLFFRGDVPERDFGHVAMAVDTTTEVVAPHTGDVVKTQSIPWDRVQAIRRIV